MTSPQLPDSWSPLHVPALRRLPDLVHVRAQGIPARHRFPPHRHRWHQLIYSVSGTVVVGVDDRRFICGPEQAVWMPVGTTHTVGSAFGATYRSLYIARAARLRMPQSYTVLEVTPLLRELILEAGRLEAHGDAPYRARVNGLILSHLPRLPRVDISLPWPQGRVLRRLCEALYAQPGAPEDIEAWGRLLGASGRTLTRQFQSDLGMNFRQWKMKLRLVKALELLAAGKAVTAIALELGYKSPSAFSYMFTREMGYSPKQHRTALARS